MITLKYERTSEFREKLDQLNPSEVKLLCPVCGSELLYAPDPETAAKLKIHPGIQCPKNWKHVSVTYHLKRR